MSLAGGFGAMDFAAQAESATLYSGFGDEASFNTSNFSTIGTDVVHAVAAHVSIAQPFRVPSENDFHLHSIQIAATSITGGQALTVRLLGEGSGPGSTGAPQENLVLEEFEVTVPRGDQRPGPPGPESIILIPSAKGPVLQAGVRYWIALSLSQPDWNTVIHWWGAPPGPSGGLQQIARKVNLGIWENVPAPPGGHALTINAAPVPADDSRSFSVITIADTTGPVQKFAPSGSIALDHTGGLIFWAELKNGTTGIFRGTGGSLDVIADHKGKLPEITELSPSPQVSSSGTVAFRGTTKDGGSAVYLSRDGTLSLVIDEAGPFQLLGRPSHNVLGTVVLLAGLDNQGGGIFALNGGTVTTIAHSSGVFRGFLDPPMINAKGTVAFGGEFDDGVAGIFTNRGGVITTIADSRATFTTFHAPDLNDRGTIAFWACTDPDQPTCPIGTASTQGIYTGNGDRLTVVADSDGPFQALSDPTINNNGTVAFLAALDSGEVGIFTGPDLVAHLVLSTGDRLAGSHVESLEFSQGLGLNDAGQIAFFARLADGTEGVYLATPQAGL